MHKMFTRMWKIIIVHVYMYILVVGSSQGVMSATSSVSLTNGMTLKLPVPPSLPIACTVITW